MSVSFGAVFDIGPVPMLLLIHGRICRGLGVLKLCGAPADVFRWSLDGFKPKHPLVFDFDEGVPEVRRHRTDPVR